VETEVNQNSNHEGSWLIEQLVHQLGQLAERERTRAIIQREARYDSLTSLHNRRAFEDILSKEIARAELEEKRTALLFINLNDFKRVNDSLGHAAGDEVLQVIAQRLQQAVRQSDRRTNSQARGEDFLSRMGGDEFTLILADIQSTNDAVLAAERVLDSLSSPISLQGQQFRVGASIGIAVFPDDAKQADALIRSADAATYAAKRKGRSSYSRYHDTDKAVDSLSFEAEIRAALENNELDMHYQPVFSCRTGEPVGAEALIRWHHPERGWITPGQFIPIAEEIGLMGELGRFQFETVLS